MIPLLVAAAISGALAKAPDRSPGDSAALQGHVIIDAKPNNMVVIGIDADRDGFSDEVFWFFSNSPVAVRLDLQQATLDYRGDDLTVITDEGRLYEFSISEGRTPRQGPRNVPDTTVFSGYGLNHSMGDHTHVRMVFSAPRRGSGETALPARSWLAYSAFR